MRRPWVRLRSVVLLGCALGRRCDPARRVVARKVSRILFALRLAGPRSLEASCRARRTNSRTRNATNSRWWRVSFTQPKQKMPSNTPLGDLVEVRRIRELQRDSREAFIVS